MKDEIKIIPFMSEDLMHLTKKNEGGKKAIAIAPEARLKHISGPAVSAFLGDELVCCAGIQTEGIGEVWACFSEEAIKRKLALLKTCRAELEGTLRVHRIWRLWSESPDTEPRKNFIKHMHFRKIEAYVRG